MSEELNKFIHEIAIDAVCSNGEPKTVYEINMVKLLEEFGSKLIKQACAIGQAQKASPATDDPLQEALKEASESRSAHLEVLATAFLAEHKIKPSEAELIEVHDGNIITWSFRRKIQ